MADAIRIENDGDAFTATPLSDTELRVFDRTYDQIVARTAALVEQSMSRPWKNADWAETNPDNLPQVSAEKRSKYAVSRVSELMQSRKLHALWGVMIAKNYLLNSVFKGVHGGGTEVVMSHIRSFNLLRMAVTATETPTATWDNFKSATSYVTNTNQGAPWASFASPTSGVPNGGTDYWIGQGSNNASVVNIDKRVCIVIFGFADLGSQRPLDSVQLRVNTTTYSPTVLFDEVALAPSDYRVPIVASRTFIIPPRAQVSGWVFANNPVSSYLIPIGVAIGEANYINLLGTSAAPQL